MKKILLFLMFALFCIPWAANAQTTLTVCDGTETNGYIPVYGYYCDADGLTSEFIIPAANLTAMNGSAISAMTFYLSTPATGAWGATFKVYLKEVAETTLTENIGPDECTLVYTGELDGTGSTMVVPFEDDYIYNGGNLLIGTYVEEAGTYLSASFYGIEATDAAYYSYEYYGYTDGGAQDFLPKTTFTYGTPASCAKPTGVTVNYTGGTTAVVNWTSSASMWQIDVNGVTYNASAEHLEPPYTLQNLDYSTTYEVKVQAVCGVGSVSNWSNVFTFTTDPACLAPTSVEASDITVDGATIGWTSDADAFNIRYAPCFVEDFENGLDNWTIVDADGDGFNWESHINTGSGNHTAHSGNGVATTASYDNDSGTALTPDNWLISPQVQLGGSVSLWAIGQDASYAAEHFAIYVSTTGTDPADFTMVSQEYVATGEYVNYIADLSSYSGMGYVAVRHFNVTDMFYLNIDDFIVYAPESAFTSINNVTDNSINLTNLNPNTTYLVQVQADCGTDGISTWASAVFTTLPLCNAPTGVTASDVTAHGAIVTWTSDASAWQIQLGEGTPIDVTEATYTFTGLTPETSYSVKVRTNCGEINSDWSNVSFTTAIACPAPTGLATSNITAHGVTITWTAEEGATYDCVILPTSDYDPESHFAFTQTGFTSNTATFTTLDPETSYTFVLRKDCSEEGYSQNATITFTTAVACPAPTGVTISDITSDGASVSWTGSANSYNLRYRTAAGRVTYFSDGFEDETLVNGDIPTGWTVIDNDGDGLNWYYLNNVGQHEGNGCMTSASYSNYALTPDNWLVTPQLEFHGTMEVWLKGQDPDWADENFAIYLTTDEPTVGNFIAGTVLVPKTMVTGEYQAYTADLSAFEGQTGYIAIRHFDVTDMFRINVDDFGLYGDSFDAGDWVTVTTDEPTATLPGLNPETEYEVQVQGNCGDEGLSTWAGTSFNTLPLCVAPTAVTVSYTGGTEATITWTSEAEAFNIHVNGTVTAVTGNSYALADLDFGTTYVVKVQTDCGSDVVSDWSEAVSFTTDLCAAENMCAISIELTDSYGDGWNGGKLEVVDVLTTNVIGSYTISSGSSASYTLNVCADRAINIVYTAGSFAYENGWVITDINEDIISEHEGGGTAPTSGVQATYTVNCVVTDCRTPSELAASEIAPISAILSWTEKGPATEWTVYYKAETAEEFSTASATVNPYTLTGLDPETEYTVYVVPVCEVEKPSAEITFTTLPACPAPTDLTYSINAGGVTVGWNGTSDNYNVQLGVDGDGEPVPTTVGFAGIIPAVFANDATYPWTIVDGHIQSSNAGVSSSTSAISVTVTYPEDGVIEFDAECKGEGTSSYWDHCDFYIDETLELYAGANISGWNHYSFNVTAGEHTFVWSYTKDSSVNPTGDYFAIDNVVLPLPEKTWEEPVASEDAVHTFTLDEAGMYYVRVQGVCDGESGAWSEEMLIDFTPVNCDAGIVLNESNPTWKENFDNMTNVTTPYTGVQPSCWTWYRQVTLPEDYVDTLSQVYYGSETAHNSDYSLKLFYRGYYSLPELNESVDITKVKMSFWNKQSRSYYVLQVGVMTDPTDPSTFVPVAYVNNGTSTDMKYVEVDFSNYTQGGTYIAFHNLITDQTARDLHSSNWIDDVTLTLVNTKCDSIGFGYNEYFDNVTDVTNPKTGVEPACWEMVHNDVELRYDMYPQVYYSSSNYSLLMADRCVYAMPVLHDSVDIKKVKLTMEVMQPYSFYQLEVGVWEESGEGGTFVPVALANNSGTGYDSFTCNFSNYNGNGRRIAFRNTLNSGANFNYSYNYIDDIELSEILSGNCSEGIDYAEYDGSFETYTESTVAQTGVEPTCWEMVHNDVELRYDKFPQVYYSTSNSYVHGGSYSLRMADRCVYAMPALSESTGHAIGDYTLTMWVSQPMFFYDLTVGVWEENADGTGTFVPVQKVNNTGAEFEQVEVDLSAYSGPGRRVAFRNTQNSGANFNYSYNYIDDISFTLNTSKSGANNGGNMDAERYLEDIVVYPNPTTGLLHIDAIDVQKVECYTQMGQLVGVYDNVNELNISELANGVYMLRITVPQGVTMRKVVKR